MSQPISQKEINAMLAKSLYEAIPIMIDVTRYPLDDLQRLVRTYRKMQQCQTREELETLFQTFERIKSGMRLLPNAPERQYLWPHGQVPTITEYVDNSDYRYWHGPDFEPYYLEVLVPEDVQPKGAVICIGGNQLGPNVLNEAYQTALDFKKLGYQAFVLLSRPHYSPWNSIESGADVARCIRIIRSKAYEYRIDPNHIALMGGSNGGAAGENCIVHFSLDQKTQDYFPKYTPDKIDKYFGCQNIFLCIYGVHFPETVIDYTKVKYPPTFLAVGMEDRTCMNNVPGYLTEQFAIKNRIEVHFFAGEGHGRAGWKMIDGVGNPNFDLWIDHADVFMQDTYENYQ